jgi:hypothetical protein
VFPTGVTFNGDGTASYQVPVPTNFTFPEVPCGAGGTRLGPIDVDVVYEHVSTGCTDTASQALTVNPTDLSCVTPPPAATVNPASPACAAMGNVVAAGAVNGTVNFTVTNSGGQALTITGFTLTSSSNLSSAATISPGAPQTINPGATRSFTITADPASAAPFGGSFDILSNDPNSPAQVCFSGTGT